MTSTYCNFHMTTKFGTVLIIGGPNAVLCCVGGYCGPSFVILHPLFIVQSCKGGPKVKPDTRASAAPSIESGECGGVITIPSIS